MHEDHGLIIGVHYEYPFGGMADRPEWLPKGEADWRRDLAAIKETGFDSIRIRIGFDSSLDDVAVLLDICQELGLRVLFGFATFYVHDNFIAEFPDAKVVDRKGQAYPIDQYDYRWQRACIDHPAYRGQRDRLVQDCVSRFGSHPAVMAWDIHNEPSIGPGDYPCCCVHTVGKYRQDLAARFASVDELNGRYGTTFASFDAVEPPHEPETSLTGFWQDWRDFCARNLNEFLLGGIAIIKRQLPDVAASFNYTHYFAPQHGGQDWWIASQLDYASHSNYPGAAPQTTAEAGTSIELLKAIAPGKEVWVAEFQGGPFANYTLWRGIHVDAEVNKIFSHGCRALYVYRWEPLMCGPEPWINGLTEPETYDTERRLAMKRVIAELREQEDLIGSGRTVPARVGIYLPRHMVWAANAHEGQLHKTVNGLYEVLTDLGYVVTFITEPFEADCPLAVVAVPFTLELSDAERAALTGYMERGGRVIAELPLTNLADCQAAGEWLGLRCREWVRPIYFIAGWSFNNDRGQFGGYAFHDRVLLDGYAGEAIAAYRDNGEPALITAGPGGRLLIPTFPVGRSYASSFHPKLRETVAGWLPGDLEPDVRIAGVPDEYRALVEARVLESALGSLLFVINRSGYAWDVEVCPRGYRAVQVKLPTYGAVRQMLTPLSA